MGFTRFAGCAFIKHRPIVHSHLFNKNAWGYFRFQAQYLRRIRLLQWQAVPENLKRELKVAAIQRDLLACDSAVFNLYALSMDEIALLEGNGI